jgi:membrane-associated PAP2 superfamily phosphatase
LWLADRIYQWSGHGWQLRDNWITSVLLHEGGRRLMITLIVALVLAAIASLRLQILQPYRRTLFYLLSSTVLAELVVNLLKQTTHVDCPWDLLRYGGQFDYVSVFTPHPGTFRFGACFPAGHASGAYAWFGLYYIARLWRPAWRHYTLGGVLLAGLVFGVGQQVRGAHFISHDLWTLAICWFTATLAYVVFWGSTRIGSRLFFPEIAD